MKDHPLTGVDPELIRQALPYLPCSPQEAVERFFTVTILEKKFPLSSSGTKDDSIFSPFTGEKLAPGKPLSREELDALLEELPPSP